MNVEGHNNSLVMNPEVLETIEIRYGRDGEIAETFFWLWSELRTRCPKTSCRKCARYIGLYVGFGSRIFGIIFGPRHDQAVPCIEMNTLLEFALLACVDNW